MTSRSRGSIHTPYGPLSCAAAGRATVAAGGRSRAGAQLAVAGDGGDVPARVDSSHAVQGRIGDVQRAVESDSQAGRGAEQGRLAGPPSPHACVGSEHVGLRCPARILAEPPPTCRTVPSSSPMAYPGLSFRVVDQWAGSSARRSAACPRSLASKSVVVVVGASAVGRAEQRGRDGGWARAIGASGQRAPSGSAPVVPSGQIFGLLARDAREIGRRERHWPVHLAEPERQRPRPRSGRAVPGRRCPPGPAVQPGVVQVDTRQGCTREHRPHSRHPRSWRRRAGSVKLQPIHWA